MPPEAPIKIKSNDATINAFFTAHVAFLNVEKQLVWSRYQAMLVANTIVITLSGRYMTAVSSVSLGLLGMCLCAFWYRLNILGWDLCRQRSEAVREFQLEACKNPQDLQWHEYHFKNAILDSISLDKIRGTALKIVPLIGIFHLCNFGWGVYQFLKPYLRSS